ncbi:beta-ketoacyl-ACP synthase [Cupriavidus pauculus]|uniref:Beta-ketoacyl-[acyl-carrier-protein] synthase II n=1 Tax=Cupriavidus pauculus TaxID=82633 RepID=A0A2N5CA11_9BURK|nr:beta-ketoacyl-ACP synthase [Cupriavidus pauculus]PLP99068.1 beta-ketoacyl-[acyl-carrier-protein] synthase II [Cupriavidus pauculus]
MTVYLHDMNVLCALGSGNDAVRAALWRSDGPSGGASTDLYTPGTALHLGVLAEAVDVSDLPPDTPPSQASRNNAVLERTLAPLRAAVDAAIARAGPTRVAIVLGTSTSGIHEGELAVRARAATGAFPAGFHYSQQELDSPARYLARRLGTAGPAYTISTACSSSAKSLSAAARLLELGVVDVAVAGGVDTLCTFTIAGFRALEAVSAARCNPLSAHRQGINLGEGAALFLMSREPGPVRLSGWGETGDAHHISAPDPTGAGARAAMQQALARARLQPGDIDYLNLHGTATEQNDAMEARAVADLFGADIPVSSTKPQTGHTLGAAGAVEAALLYLTLTGNPRGRLPAHWWDGALDPDIAPLHVVGADESLGRPVRHAMSNSFAFGGSNCVLVMSEG